MNFQKCTIKLAQPVSLHTGQYPIFKACLLICIYEEQKLSENLWLSQDFKRNRNYVVILNSPNSSEIWRSSFSEFQAFAQTDA